MDYIHIELAQPADGNHTLVSTPRDIGKTKVKVLHPYEGQQHDKVREAEDSQVTCSRRLHSWLAEHKQ